MTNHTSEQPVFERNGRKTKAVARNIFYFEPAAASLSP